MLSLVLAGGLSTDPLDHYIGQVHNLLEIICQKSRHTFHRFPFFFSTFVSEEQATARCETQFKTDELKPD